MLLGTLVLPQLSAFGINFFGWKVPVNATEVRALACTDILHMALIVVPIIIVSIILGLWWNKRQWLINAGIWYVIYIVFYTSMFTNVEAGFFTGFGWLTRLLVGTTRCKSRRSTDLLLCSDPNSNVRIPARHR